MAKLDTENTFYTTWPPVSCRLCRFSLLWYTGYFVRLRTGRSERGHQHVIFHCLPFYISAI